MTWQRQPVEKRIMPLVQALNRPGLVWTLASCEGHPSRGTGPYVSFSCPVGVAAQIAKCLSHLYTDDKLNYYWEVVGRLHPSDGRLSFRLQAPELEPMGLIAELKLRASRRKLDDDLFLLGKEIENLVSAFIEGQGHRGGKYDDDTQYSVPPPLPCLVPVGVSAVAVGAALGVRGNGTSTNDTTGQSGHGCLQRGPSGILNLPHPYHHEEAP